MPQTRSQHAAHARVYILVFAALAALTMITVGISHLHLAPVAAIVLALAIASVKGFLVMGFFMHLLSEKQVVVAVLGLMAIFFLALLILPAWTSG